jgi:hypothetical protein
MKELKEDVQAYYQWAQKEYEGEEINFLIFEVQSAINNLNRYINNEFKRQAMGKTGMRQEQRTRTAD